MTDQQYWTLREFRKRLRVSEQTVILWCREGRLTGAVRAGKVWMIPVGTKRPRPRRVPGGSKGLLILLTHPDGRSTGMTAPRAWRHEPGVVHYRVTPRQVRYYRMMARKGFRLPEGVRFWTAPNDDACPHCTGLPVIFRPDPPAPGS